MTAILSNVPPRKTAFVMAPTDYGPMLVNRFDFNRLADGGICGVGHSLLETSTFDPVEVDLILQFLVKLRELRGDGVFMLDGGANIGVHALAAGRLMNGWGSVLSFEAQERIFYALAGNVAMNNLFNVTVRWNALDSQCSIVDIPVVDYLRPSSFGSLEMLYNENSEFIGQPVDKTKTTPVRSLSIDSLQLPRLDMLKLDVEGMEERVLSGAAETLSRCKPVIHFEQLKSDKPHLVELLQKLNYVVFDNGPNSIAIYNNDKILESINK